MDLRNMLSLESKTQVSLYKGVSFFSMSYCWFKFTIPGDCLQWTGLAGEGAYWVGLIRRDNGLVPEQVVGSQVFTFLSNLKGANVRLVLLCVSREFRGS